MQHFGNAFWLKLQYSAISIWDYSSTGPSTKIDTNPSLPGAAKDIVFFSANKFIGGVQAPGESIISFLLVTNSKSNFHCAVAIKFAIFVTAASLIHCAVAMINFKLLLY